MALVSICANCTASNSTAEGFGTEIRLNSSEEKAKFSKIIATIFSPAATPFSDQVKSDDEWDSWTLCSTCSIILTQLYTNYQSFVKLTKKESLIYEKYFSTANRIPCKKRKVCESASDPSFLSNDTDAVCVKLENERPDNWENEYENFDTSHLDRHDPLMNNFIIIPDEVKVESEKKKRGRPRKINLPPSLPSLHPKKKVGRPRKVASHPPVINNERIEPGTGSRSPTRNEDAEIKNEIKKTLRRERKCRSRKSKVTHDSEESSSSCIFKGEDQDQDVDLKEDEEDNEGKEKKPRKKSASKRTRKSRPSKFEIEMVRGTKFFKCPTEGCTKMATTSSNLMTHIKCVHEQERRFKCKTCDKFFASNSALQLHTIRFHSSEGGQLYVCKVPGCGRSFAFPASLATHRFDHVPQTEFPFTCGICVAKFKRSCDLANHMARHSEERAWMCDICAGRYKTKVALRKHIKFQHSDAMVRTCEICGKQLRNIFNLRIHIQNVHNVTKSHLCPTCGKSFSSGSGLKKHEESQHHSHLNSNHAFQPETGLATL